MSSLNGCFMYKNHFALEPPGSIAQYYGTTDPDGWIICDGQTRSVSDGRFGELYIILGNGNSNSITPPDLRNRFLYGTTSNIGTTGGSTTRSLAIEHIPSHNHGISISDPGHSHTVTASQGAHSHTSTITDPGHSHTITASQDAHSHTVDVYDYGHRHLQYAYSLGDGKLGGGQDGGVYKGTSYNGSNLVNTGNFTTRSGTRVNTANTDQATPSISGSASSASTDITSNSNSKNPTIRASANSASTGISASSNSQQPGIDASSTASSTGISASSSSIGNGNSFNTMPPYYTVNFIMKY